MLAALNVVALLMGIASGGLVASLLALVVGGSLTLAGVESGADVGLIAGVVAGLAVGGWVAGRRAPHSARFHGSMTGVVFAFVILVMARIGGSPAGTSSVVWLALVSITISGSCGWLAGRRGTSGA